MNCVSPHGPVSIRQASLAVLIEPVGRRLLPYTPWRYCRSIRPKALRDLHEGGHDLAVLHELRIATDVVLQATKMTAQSLGHVMSTLVVQERHLWLCLTDMKEQEKVQFLNAPESQTSLFGDAVESCAQQFSAAQKQTEAIKTSCARGNLLLPLRLQPLSLLVAVGAAAAAFHQAVSWSRSQAGRPAHPGPRQTWRQAQVQEVLRRATRRWTIFCLILFLFSAAGPEASSTQNINKRAVSSVFGSQKEESGVPCITGLSYKLRFVHV